MEFAKRSPFINLLKKQNNFIKSFHDFFLVKGISLMIALPVIAMLLISFLFLEISSLNEIEEYEMHLTHKRYVEDYLSAVVQKVKNFFHITFFENGFYYHYNPDFNISVTVNKTNKIVFNDTYGNWWEVSLSDDLTTVYHNLSSIYYAFWVPGRITFIYYYPFGPTRETSYYFFFDDRGYYGYTIVNRGFFLIYFRVGARTYYIVLDHSYKEVYNPYREDFIMLFDKYIDLKKLLWFVEIERGRFYYRGYIIWR